MADTPGRQISRENLLGRLQSVASGVAPKGAIEQSDCFVFKDGWLFTFNDEIACRIPSKLGKEFTGAVKARPLLDLLSKLGEDTLTLESGENCMTVRGSRKKTTMPMESDVTLAYSVVERPDKWNPLAEDFADALEIVSQCADKKDDRITKYLHLQPKFMEAMGGFQLARYKLDTGVSEQVLVKSEAVRQSLACGMQEIALTDSWLHFRNESKLVFSCRRYQDNYPDISEFLEIKNAVPVVLPKKLLEAVARTSIFASKDGDQNFVKVEIRPGKIKLTAAGAYGKHSEWPSLTGYTGKPLAFVIQPELLASITKRYNEVLVSAERLRVGGGKFVYAAALSRPEDVQEPETQEDKK